MICLTAWLGHTDASRLDAHVIRLAVRSLGWKEAEAAAKLGVDEKTWSRILAGQPLNHWRFVGLPIEFQRAYDNAKAALRGAVVLEADSLAILRGALALGRKRMLAMFPDVVQDRRRA